MVLLLRNRVWGGVFFSMQARTNETKINKIEVAWAIDSMHLFFLLFLLLVFAFSIHKTAVLGPFVFFLCVFLCWHTHTAQKKMSSPLKLSLENYVPSRNESIGEVVASAFWRPSLVPCAWYPGIFVACERRGTAVV